MRCSVARGGVAACHGEATVTLVVGCVHEHVRERQNCVEHADQLMSKRRVRLCRPCLEAGYRVPLVGLAVREDAS